MGERIDVSIVAYRSAPVIGEVVDGARALGHVVVVDHGSDGAADTARAHGARAFNEPNNPGFGAGQNRGLRYCSTPYVLLLNPDAFVEPSAVRRGAELLTLHPDVAAVQGVVVGPAGPERSAGRSLRPYHLLGRATGARRLLGSSSVRRLAQQFHAFRDHVDRLPQVVTEVEWLAATVLLVRRSAFEEVGGFDERYFLYGEDLDLCWRLRAAGYRLITLPEVWAAHRSGGSSATWYDRELQWWRGTLRFTAMWWTNVEFVAGLASSLLMVVRLLVAAPTRWRDTASALLLSPLAVRRERR